MIHIRWRIIFSDLVHHALLLLIALVFLWVVFLSVLRLSLPWVSAHPEIVSDTLGSFLGAKVSFRKMDIYWGNLKPEIVLYDTHILGANKVLMQIPSMNIRFALLESLLEQKVVIEHLQVKDWKFHINQNDQGRWGISGIEGLTQNVTPENSTALSVQDVLSPLMQIHRLELQNATIEMNPQKQTPFLLEQLNLNWRIQKNHLVVYGSTFLSKGSAHEIPIKFSGQWHGGWFGHSADQLSGMVYLYTGKFPLLSVLPKIWFDQWGITLQNGDAQAQMWANWQKDHWESVSTVVQSNQLSLKKITPSSSFGVKAETVTVKLHWQPLLQVQKIQFVVESENGFAEFGKLFKEPLSYQVLRLEGIWDKSVEAGSTLTMPLVELQTPDADVTGKLRLDLGASTEPNLFLLGKAHFKSLDHVRADLPVGIMPPAVVHWLDHAIVSGDSADAQILWDGPPKHFPFHDQSGLMQIFGQVHNVDLNYEEGWPLLTHLDADLYFTSHGMLIHANKGLLGALPINNVDAVIPVFQQKSELQITSVLQGDLKNAWNFLQHSPLKIKLTSLLEEASAEGPFGLGLNLFIPLYQGGAGLQYQGNIALNKSSLILHNLPVAWANLTGKIRFDSQTVSSSALQGDWLTMPWVFNLKKEKETPEITLDMQGKVPVDDLMKNTASTFSGWISGAPFLTARLQWGDRDVHLKVDSTTKDLVIRFPGLAKEAVSEAPLSLSVTSLTHQPPHVVFHWALPQSGVQVSADQGIWNFVTPIGQAQLIQPLSETSPWRLQLQNVHLEGLKGVDKTTPVKAIRTLPMDIDVRGLYLPGMVLDHLAAKLRPIANGTNITALSLQQGDVTLSAQGIWQNVSENFSETQLQGTLQATQFKNLLDFLGMPPFAQADNPVIKFNVTWPSALWQFDRTKMHGHIDVSAGHGIFTDISDAANSKFNFGRMLSLLSLADLPEHFLSKFRDMSEKGFPFDSVQGGLDFIPGHKRPMDLDVSISGPFADVMLNGCMNPAEKDLNLVAKIKPNVTSGLPLIATLTGGPVMGAISFLASKILRPAAGQLSQSNYAITGTADAVKTEKINMLQAQKILGICGSTRRGG